jgi:hypothetical protein
MTKKKTEYVTKEEFYTTVRILESRIRYLISYIGEDEPSFDITYSEESSTITGVPDAPQVISST